MKWCIINHATTILYHRPADCFNCLNCLLTFTMDIQSSSLPYPTTRGSAQRYTRALVAHQAVPQTLNVASSAPTAQPGASLINGRPDRLSAQQAAAVYRAIERFSGSPASELLNRIDTRV